MGRFDDYHSKPGIRARDGSGRHGKYLEARANLEKVVPLQETGFWYTEMLKAEMKWGSSPCDSSPHP